MAAVAVSAAATVLALALLVAALRNLVCGGPVLPPQRLPTILANLLGLAAFLVGMVAGREFWP